MLPRGMFQVISTNVTGPAYLLAVFIGSGAATLVIAIFLVQAVGVVIGGEMFPYDDWTSLGSRSLHILLFIVTLSLDKEILVD